MHRCGTYMVCIIKLKLAARQLKMDAHLIPEACPFCNKKYRDPKLLPCFHILCRDCVSDLSVKDREQVSCPVERCGREFIIENKDPENLPDALPVYYRRDVRSLKAKVEKGEAKCKVCFHSNHTTILAVAFCNTCYYLCKDCVHQHETDHRDHEIISFLELSQSDTDHMHHNILRRLRAKSFIQRVRCKDPNHTKELAEAFCLDCSTFTCRKCIDDKHADHRLTVVTRAVEECKTNLVEKMPNVRLVHKRLAGGVYDVQKARISIQDQQTELTSSVEHTFSRLTNVLLRRKQDLISKLSQISGDKLKRLQQQQIELEKMTAEFMRLEEYIENTIEMSTDVELLHGFKFLQDRSRDMLQKGSKLPVQPVEVANMAIKNTSEIHLRDLCQKHINVFVEQANPSSCTVEGSGLKSAETEKHAYLTVNVVDKNHKPCSCVQNVSVKLKCVENDFISSAEIVERNTSKYDATYCPQFRGKHELSVQVNGHSIPGSPYLVNVTKPPLRLGQSQGMIYDVTGPRGIAINQARNLVVSEWNGRKIVELDKFGRQVREFGEGQLNHPASVSIGGDGSMYVSDGAGESCCLVKYNKEGHFVKKIGKEGRHFCEFSNPRGVRVSSSNEVWICDRDNHRLQIFNSDLGFLRSIDLRRIDLRLEHVPKPNDITFDKAGNFFVADFANHCILCFSQTGDYLFSFAGNSLSNQMLHGPECIAIDQAGFLYVTESGNHRISIFTLTGELVNTFGNLGRNEGELKFPMGIVVDENGSVFVCELLNNRIQMF